MRGVLKIMEFIKNNSTILITGLVAIISGCFNVYQHFENKILKKYGTEKDLKRRQASLEKLIKDYNEGYDLLILPQDATKKESDFIYRKKCIEAEIECLEKILKIKNHG